VVCLATGASEETRLSRSAVRSLNDWCTAEDVDGCLVVAGDALALLNIGSPRGEKVADDVEEVGDDLIVCIRGWGKIETKGMEGGGGSSILSTLKS